MQLDAASISSAERRSLLKAWGEMDVGYSEGPIDYLWLFYTAFYTAKGIARAKSFYVTRLSIWKESALRLSFFHEYLVATIRSTNHADKREYYLLFERTAGELNTEQKTEEDLGEKAAGQEDEVDASKGNDGKQSDTAYIPDRRREHKTFGHGAKNSGQHSDDEGGPGGTSSRATSPKSDGFGGMLGMFFAAKDLASNASESSSADMILADDRYELLNHPYRSPSDIEVAWIILGKPNVESTTDPAANPSSPPSKSAPTSPLSPTGPPPVPQISAQFPKCLPSEAPLPTSRFPLLIQSKPAKPNHIPKLCFQLPLSARALRSSPPIGGHHKHDVSVHANASLPLITSPNEHPSPVRPGHETLPSPLSEKPPLITSRNDDEDVPVPTETFDNDSNEASSPVAEEFPLPEHPLVRGDTNLSDKSHTSKISIISRSSRLMRRSSFSTLNYDALTPLPPRGHIYFYELVVLACRLHKCKSLYRIFTRNCYWFAGMIFHVIRVFTGVDAAIYGDDDSVERMKPSNEVMMWVNSGRMGTFLRSVRIVKAPRLFTIYALIRKWHGAIVRFEDQVNVNFADNTPEQTRILQLVMEGERRKRMDAEARRQKAEVEADKKLEEERKKHEEERKRLEEEREEERKKLEEEREEERKKLEEEREEERKKHGEERRRYEEERKRREEEKEEETRERTKVQRRLHEMEKMMNEYQKMLEEHALSPRIHPTEVAEDVGSMSSEEE